MSYILIKTAEQKVIEKKIESIKKLKELCKKEKTYKDLCKKYRKSIDCIDGVSISFCDELETTARTKNGEIFLSEKKLLNAETDKQLRYIIHEMVHVFQHIQNENKKQKKPKEYTEDPNEIEAFQFQLEYQEDKEGNVKEYLNNFLDYHEVPDKKRKDLLDDLTKRMEDPDIVDEVLND